MKKIFLFVASALVFSSGYAQLTTRENDATVEKLGARPVAGDMALTFGLDLSMDSTATGIAKLNVFNRLRTGDILTFKYYTSDNVAIRAGLRLYKNSEKSDGTVADSTAIINQTNPSSPNWLQEMEYKSSRREYIIVPGIEKHFSAANIFDVYMGGDLYLGLGKNDSVFNRTFTDGDFRNFRARTNTTVIGLGGVVGFNVFIAHLPISLGLEYGWNAKWIRGGKTKINEEIQVTTGNTIVTDELEYYIHPNDPMGPDPNGGQYKYSDLNRSRFTMDTNQDVRLVLNIYFGK